MMYRGKRIKNIAFAFVTVTLFLAVFDVGTAMAIVENESSFYVDQVYDLDARQAVQATLVKTSPNIYFYLEKEWWDLKDQTQKDAVLLSLDNLSKEFNSKIYPILTSTFGKEWRPGIDNDTRVAILFHKMGGGVGGYIRSSDEYSKLQEPSSNQREMVYLPIEQIMSPKLNEFLAHEFSHLIIFNQKEKLQGVQEEIWLNEARADYASTILGYDDFYQGSNLQRRIVDFLQKPDDSLVEWQGSKYDYAALSLFTHYLVDHYGLEVLSKSLKSNSIGIESLNEALSAMGIQENFAEIFTNWTIAAAINNCSVGPRYCYLNPYLSNIRISPSLLFLPASRSSSLTSANFTKNWAGNWHKVIIVSGDLKLKFSVGAGLNFKIPYITIDKNNIYSVKYLVINKNGIGEINMDGFSDHYNSLIIIPSLQDKDSGFDVFERSYGYELEVLNQKNQQNSENLIQNILAQIESLKKQIASLEQSNQNIVACTNIYSNLYFGVSNSNEVNCLQRLLKSQGQDVYPEALVTGNFLNLTKLAVIRFQEKYKAEILTPLGLSSGTGFVGSLTRAKINQLLIN